MRSLNTNVLVRYDALVRRSVQAYRVGRGNFSEYLIGEISTHHGCRDIVTFNRALKGFSGFTVLA